MRGYGTHGQPAGTWSDDAALSFALAQSLCDRGGPDYEDMGRKFVRWMEEGYWSARGNVFDIGNTTLRALMRIREGVNPTGVGPDGEYTQGNGALMRILPLVLYLHGRRITGDAFFETVHNVTRITNGHPVCQVASGLYVYFAAELLNGASKGEAFARMRRKGADYYGGPEWKDALSKFRRILDGTLILLPASAIQSTGYVVHTLEAALWAFLTEDSFQSAVLKAVNLGDDTDTSGAVTGGLSGLYYGMEGIPSKWLETLARKDDIVRLADCLVGRFYGGR